MSNHIAGRRERLECLERTTDEQWLWVLNCKTVTVTNVSVYNELQMKDGCGS